MLPKDYFKKTFVFVFIFFVVYKFVGVIMNGDFVYMDIVKILAIGLITALILGGINYFLKWDFFPTKAQRRERNQ